MAGQRRRRPPSCATSRRSPRERHRARTAAPACRCPTCDFDTALVVYRHVNVEGFVTHRLNLYSVPWSYIGQVLPVRVTESEVIVYSIGLEEIARHRLVPGTADRRAADDQEPSSRRRSRRADAAVAAALRRTRSRSPCSSSTACWPSKSRANCKPSNCWHWWRITSVTTCVPRFERAVRFGAFSLAAIRRILAATARPKPLLDELADLHRDTLDPLLREDPIGPRPTSDYQHLLSPEEACDETPSAEKPDDEPDEPDSDPKPA